MINIEKVSKSFGKLSVLKEISLAMDESKCYALIGPNASGKTTLIKSVLGLVIPDSGNIYVKGAAIKKDWQYRKYIGYMPQIGRYPENMTIHQLLRMLIDIRKTTWAECDTELIRKFGIDIMEGKRLGTLSGGTRQKVSASLAYLFNPDILILDEPTAGLDPVSTEILKEKILAEKLKGRLTIITSHVLSDLDELVDEIVFLQEGKIILKKNAELIRFETGETRLSKAIARVMGYEKTT